MDGGGSAPADDTSLFFLRKNVFKSGAPVRIVLTSEYRTTKACPCCRSPDSKMVQPRGNATYDDKNGVVRRKRIHGLSQCGCCQRLWSRDYAASLNIGRSFVSHFRTREGGGLPVSLETTRAQCAPRRSSCLAAGRSAPSFHRETSG